MTIKQDVLTLASAQRGSLSSLLVSFCEFYLSSIPEPSLKLFSPEGWVEFLLHRFDYFEKSLSKKEQEDLRIFKLEHADYPHSYAIERVGPDAAFLLLTIETSLGAQKYRIKKVLHPILGIRRNSQGFLSEIKQAEGELVSVIYIEFESDHAIETIELEKDIKSKVNAAYFAYKDAKKMLERMIDAKNILSKHPNLSKEWIDLCDWLNNYNFSFFGYIETRGKNVALQVLKESGLGILSQSCEGNWNERFLHILKNQPDPTEPIFFGTVPIASPIQRFDHLMHLCVQDKGSDSRYHFMGLLKRSSLMVNNRETPLIREKMKFIFDYKKMVVGSHDYNQTIRYLMAVPKFELFRLSRDILSKMVEDLLSITTPSSVFAFQHKISNHSMFILLVVPTMHLNTKTKEDIHDYFKKKFEGLSYEIIPVLSEHLSRFHIHLASPELPGSLEEITDSVQDIVKPWSDRL